MNNLNDFKYEVAKPNPDAVLNEVRRCLVLGKNEEALMTVQEYLTMKNVQIFVDAALDAMKQAFKENFKL